MCDVYLSDQDGIEFSFGKTFGVELNLVNRCT